MRYPNFKPYDDDGNAWCSKCHTYKPRTAFPDSKFTAPENFSSVRCVACNHEYAKRYTQKRKRYSWHRHYGIDEERYAQLFKDQHGVCAICGHPETRIVRGTLASLTVDH